MFGKFYFLIFHTNIFLHIFKLFYFVYFTKSQISKKHKVGCILWITTDKEKRVYATNYWEWLMTSWYKRWENVFLFDGIGAPFYC